MSLRPWTCGFDSASELVIIIIIIIITIIIIIVIIIIVITTTKDKTKTWRNSSEEPKPTEAVTARRQYRELCGLKSSIPQL